MANNRLFTMFLLLFNIGNLNVFVLSLRSRRAAGLRGAYWPKPSNIVVCWETPGWAKDKKLVRHYVRESWEKYSRLRFTEWTDCLKLKQTADIRIQIADRVEHVKEIGRLLRGRKNGMVLNFALISGVKKCRNPWAKPVFQLRCLRYAAVHEFGHAIGLTHEQNRRDKPPSCRKHRNGPNPDHMITVYDADSVMNYCNGRNDGTLSKGDIKAVGKIYGRVTKVIVD